jgi:hypothetical protein
VTKLLTPDEIRRFDGTTRMLLESSNRLLNRRSVFIESLEKYMKKVNMKKKLFKIFVRPLYAPFHFATTAVLEFLNNLWGQGTE